MKGINTATIGDRPAFGYLLQLMQAGRYDTAEDVAASLIGRYPDHAEAMYHMGIIAAYRDKNWAGAARMMGFAAELRPEWPEARYNLGFFNQRRGLEGLEEAEAHYRRALELQPGMAGALTNLGTLALGRGEHTEAIRLFTEACGSKEAEPLARYNRAMAYLLTGDWERGWEDYEQRLLSPLFTTHVAPYPLWDGTPQPGKTLLVNSDQGLGDVIMCMRWSDRVERESGMQVIWRVQQPLISLFPNAWEGTRCVSDDEPCPKADFQIPVMSLPHRMGARPDTLSGRPYLPPVQRHGVASGSVALSWAGSPTHENDAYRSLPAGAVKDLMARCGDAQWASVQLGARAEEAGLPVPDLPDLLATAQLLMGCRALVTVDTAVAHLAGALGVPCFLMLAAFPDFRWGIDAVTTPWYDSVRLYRQRKVGEWGEVFDAVAKDLGAMLRKEAA